GVTIDSVFQADPIIAAFLLARSPSWKSLRRPTPW
ncbi:TPA: hypothetical protein ACTYZD_005840, partial [Klebsiella pneumoniae]